MGVWGLGDPQNDNFLEFFGIFVILTSNGTRKCLWSYEKSKVCNMDHPTPVHDLRDPNAFLARKEKRRDRS